MKSVLPALAAAALLCVPAGGQTAGPPEPAEAPPPAETGPTTAPPRLLRYRIVAEKSVLRFELPTSFHTVNGQVGAWSGRIAVDPGEPGRLRAHIEIKAGSLTTGNASRDADMLTKVLEADRYPTIAFDAESYKGDLARFEPGALLSLEVSGALTIHGVHRPAQTSVECAVINDHVLVAGAVPVHWKEFGLRDMSRWFNKVKDPLTVIFRLWAVPAGPGT
jgi:polyisoprenoid-binding protein YceI